MSKSKAHADAEMVAKRPPREILRQEIHEGMESMRIGALGLFISGVSAGLDIGFSPLLAAIMTTRTAGVLSLPVSEILHANMYAVGFIFVVLGRSELFTEQTTLAVLPVLNRSATLGSLLRLWATVYVANLLGGIGFAAVGAHVGTGLRIVDPDVFGQMALAELDYSDGALFTSAVLAGWLMGLLSWLVSAARETAAQLLIVWLITWVIGFSHLHHVIAGAVPLLMAEFAGEGVGLSQIGRFLLWATLGNILGGSVFVALIKYGQIALGSPIKEKELAA
ncbi:MAG TPA: formate/nitrite transporter family protein [Pirellulales bacterium]|nr:formate/nitrite transporter family protein [Pirellulales bacterium]